MVADWSGHRILLLNSELKLQRVLVDSNPQVKLWWSQRIHHDELTSRLYVVHSIKDQQSSPEIISIFSLQWMINSLSVFTRLLTYLTRMYVIPLLVCIKQTSIYLVYTPVARTFSDSFLAGHGFGGLVQQLQDQSPEPLVWTFVLVSCLQWIESTRLCYWTESIESFFFFAELTICKSYPWPCKPSPEPWRSSVRPCSCGLDSTSVCISA